MIAADHAISREHRVFAEGACSANRLLADDTLLAEYPVSAEGLSAVEGLSAAETPWEIRPLLVVPRFVKEMIAAQERGGSDKAPNLTIGQWLHAQPPAVQQRERLRALRRLGLVGL